MNLRLLFGIGNPGAEYAGTRHNLGFELLARLAPGPFRLLSGLDADGTAADAARLELNAGEVSTASTPVSILLVRPLTYVNQCGPVLAALLERYELAIEHCLVAVDDLDLPTGVIRLRGEGSPGGHNGLRSVESALGTPAYPRLRLGVGGDGARAHPDYVLARFPESDQEAVSHSLDRAALAVRQWATSGLQAAMGEANRRLLDPDGNRP